MKKPFLILAVIVAIAGGYLALRTLFAPRTEAPIEPTAEQTGRPQNASPTQNNDASQSGGGMAPPAEAAAPALTAFSSDPHDISPQVLIAYAERLAPKMEEAEKSPEKAREFFGELEGCVSGATEKNPTIQALCLSTAEELSDVHADLAERYRALHAATPPSVLKVIDEAETIDR